MRQVIPLNALILTLLSISISVFAEDYTKPQSAAQVSIFQYKGWLRDRAGAKSRLLFRNAQVEVRYDPMPFERDAQGNHVRPVGIYEFRFDGTTVEDQNYLDGSFVCEEHTYDGIDVEKASHINDPHPTHDGLENSNTAWRYVEAIYPKVCKG